MGNIQPSYVENPSILWKSAEMVGEMPLRNQIFEGTWLGRCE